MNSPLTIDVERPGNPAASSPIVEGIYTIGSGPGNKIILPSPQVSDKHAVLSLRNGQFVLEDLGSTNGTKVNNAPVNGRVSFEPGMPISIGEFTITLRDTTSKPAPTPEPSSTPREQTPQPNATPPAPQTTMPTSSGDAEEDDDLKLTRAEREQYIHIKQQIHLELLERLDLKRMTATGQGENELRQQAQETIETIVRDVSAKLPPTIDPSNLAIEIYNEAILLGPLEELLSDDDITEIMVNGHDHVYVEKKGRLTLSDKTFVNDSSLHCFDF